MAAPNSVSSSSACCRLRRARRYSSGLSARIITAAARAPRGAARSGFARTCLTLKEQFYVVRRTPRKRVTQAKRRRRRERCAGVALRRQDVPPAGEFFLFLCTALNSEKSLTKDVPLRTGCGTYVNSSKKRTWPRWGLNPRPWPY